MLYIKHKKFGYFSNFHRGEHNKLSAVVCSHKESDAIAFTDKEDAQDLYEELVEFEQEKNGGKEISYTIIEKD